MFITYGKFLYGNKLKLLPIAKKEILAYSLSRVIYILQPCLNMKNTQ